MLLPLILTGMAVHHPAVTREGQGQKHHPKLDWSIIDHLQTLLLRLHNYTLEEEATFYRKNFKTDGTHRFEILGIEFSSGGILIIMAKKIDMVDG